MKDAHRQRELVPGAGNGAADNGRSGRKKVTIIGMGQVGLAAASSILQRNIVTDMALVDIDDKRLKGEVLDFRDSGAFLTLKPEVVGSTKFDVTKDSNVVIITAGARQKQGEKRDSMLGRSVQIYNSIIPKLMENTPNCVILVATNPVDEMTYVTFQMSGLPLNRCIGSGSNLDSGRFRCWVAEEIDVRMGEVEGWVVGEHGDLCVPVWSGVTVKGKPLLEQYPNFLSKEGKKKLDGIKAKVVRSAFLIRELKAYTNWGIGSSLADITHSILDNTGNTHCVSTILKGMHGINVDGFVSFPATIGSDGIRCIKPMRLSKEEEKNLQEAANKIYKNQLSLEIKQPTF